MSNDIKMQVAAFPGTPYRRLKGELESFVQTQIPAGMTVRFVQSENNFQADIGKAELIQIERNIQDGFVHIGVIPTRHWGALHVFELDCRLVRLDIPAWRFKGLTAAQVAEPVLAALEYERQWCATVRPADWHSPLWLPPPSFEVDAGLGNYWDDCDCYREPAALAHAKDILERVTARYRYTHDGTHWIDERSRRFRMDQSHHGMTAKQRAGQKDFRFAREVPSGFHYDVLHVDYGKKFFINSNARRYEGCRRVNVNPWGNCVVKD